MASGQIANVSLVVPSMDVPCICKPLTKAAILVIGLLLVAGAVIAYFKGLEMYGVATLGVVGGTFCIVSLIGFVCSCVSAKFQPEGSNSIGCIFIPCTEARLQNRIIRAREGLIKAGREGGIEAANKYLDSIKDKEALEGLKSSLPENEVDWYSPKAEHQASFMYTCNCKKFNERSIFFYHPSSTLNEVRELLFARGRKEGYEYSEHASYKNVHISLTVFENNRLDGRRHSIDLTDHFTGENNTKMSEIVRKYPGCWNEGGLGGVSVIFPTKNLATFV